MANFQWCCALLVGLPWLMCRAEEMLGEGIWSVIKVEDCNADYPMKCEITREKLNRTTDAFNAKLELPFELHSGLGIQLDIYKYMDGGCKLYQQMNDDSACDFINKYSEKNFKEFLKATGSGIEECPVAADTYNVERFILDYEDLPPKACYGRFRAELKVQEKNDDATVSVLASLTVEVIFKKKDDEDDDE